MTTSKPLWPLCVALLLSCPNADALAAPHESKGRHAHAKARDGDAADTTDAAAAVATDAPRKADSAQRSVLAGDDDDGVADAAPADSDNETDAAADALHAKAYALYEKRKYRDVVRCIDQRIAENPSAASVDVLLLKGYAYVGLDDNVNTLAAAKAALALDPDNLEAIDMFANAAALTGDTDAAIAQYRRAMEKKDDNARLYNNYMSTLVDAKRWDDVKTLFAHYERRKKRGGMEESERFEDDVLFYASVANDMTGDKRAAMALINRAIASSPDFAGYYVNRGVLHATAHDNAKALADYNRAISLNPDETLAYFNRGNAFLEMEAYDKAVQDFLQARKLGKNDWNLENNLGNAYSHSGHREEARAAYLRALKLDPDNGEVKNNLAILEGESGDDARSARLYSEAESGAADKSIPPYNRAVDLMRSEKYDDAIPLLLRALKFKPDFPAASNRLAICHLKKGRYADAETLLSKTLERHPGEVDLLANLAQAQMWLGRIADADATYHKALSANPDMTELYLSLAQMHMNHGDRDKAAGYFATAETAGLASLGFYLDDTAYQIESGNAAKAVALGEAGLARYPDAADLMVNLANAYDASGKSDKAEPLLLRAAKQAPDDATVRNNLGLYYLDRAGKPAKAIPHLLAAVRLDGTLMQPRLYLAQAYVAMSDFASAENTYAELVHRFPDEPRAYLARAEYQRARGDTAGANADLEKGLALAERTTQTSASRPLDAQSAGELALLKADARQKLGRCSEAMRDYRAYLALVKTDATAYANAAYCAVEVGELRQAVVDFEAAHALDPSDLDACIGLFVANALLGDKANARKYRQIIARKLGSRLDGASLQRLANDGYFYSPRFIELWRSVLTE